MQLQVKKISWWNANAIKNKKNLILPSVQNKFDLSYKIHQICYTFLEKELDTHFEKIAKSLVWPSKNLNLTNTECPDREIPQMYGSLNLETISDFEEVKKYILEAHESVPEACRQKLRIYV